MSIKINARVKEGIKRNGIFHHVHGFSRELLKFERTIGPGFKLERVPPSKIEKDKCVLN